ncbi:uncharacterized protein PADG_03493 [Paracoccidioides brasiliensis Pb18]|uniref:Uncharacterized protein n=1 Tax=Paracoccidioides brasiliensis (strain Pb18) TaxID=502780 RepID=C1G5C3_PARBD|nr:uncharacterized protein PADG_03493 [Paracoccidioides brasiliensis Pb18]EEH47395.1 hypothetical protein PADG_03493 [Paracoccidioides brasiliensis Pb18]
MVWGRSKPGSALDRRLAIAKQALATPKVGGRPIRGRPWRSMAAQFVVFQLFVSTKVEERPPGSWELGSNRQSLPTATRSITIAHFCLIAATAAPCNRQWTSKDGILS